MSLLTTTNNTNTLPTTSYTSNGKYAFSTNNVSKYSFDGNGGDTRRDNIQSSNTLPSKYTFSTKLNSKYSFDFTNDDITKVKERPEQVSSNNIPSKYTFSTTSTGKYTFGIDNGLGIEQKTVYTKIKKIKSLVKKLRTLNDTKQQQAVFKNILEMSTKTKAYIGEATLKFINNDKAVMTGVLLKRLVQEGAGTYLGVGAPIIKLGTDMTINLTKDVYRAYQEGDAKKLPKDLAKTLIGTVASNLTPFLGDGYGAMLFGMAVGNTVKFLLLRQAPKPVTVPDMATTLERPLQTNVDIGTKNATTESNGKTLAADVKKSVVDSISAYAIASGIAAIGSVGYALYSGTLTPEQAYALLPSREGVYNLVQKKLSQGVKGLAKDVLSNSKGAAKAVGGGLATTILKKYTDSAKKKAKEYVRTIANKWGLENVNIIPKRVRQELESRAFSAHIYNMTLSDLAGAGVDAGALVGGSLMTSAVVQQISGMINDPEKYMNSAFDAVSSAVSSVSAAANVAYDATSSISSIPNVAYNSVSNAASAMYDASSSAANIVSNSYNTASDAASNAYNTASDAASNAYNTASDTASNAYSTASSMGVNTLESMHSIIQNAVDMSTSTTSTIKDTYEYVSKSIGTLVDTLKNLDMLATQPVTDLEPPNNDVNNAPPDYGNLSFEEALDFEKSKEYYAGYSDYRNFFENTNTGSIGDSILPDGGMYGLGYHTLSMLGGVGSSSTATKVGSNILRGLYYGSKVVPMAADAATLYNVGPADTLNNLENNINDVNETFDEFYDRYNQYLYGDQSKGDSILDAMTFNPKDTLYKAMTGENGWLGEAIFGKVYSSST